MKRKSKIMILTLLTFVLLSCVTAVSASDTVDNTTVATTTIVDDSTNTVTSAQDIVAISDNTAVVDTQEVKTIKENSKSLKKDSIYQVDNTTLCNNNIDGTYTNNGSGTTINTTCILCSDSDTLSTLKSVKSLSSSRSLKSDYNGNYTFIFNGEGDTTGETLSTNLVTLMRNQGATIGTRNYVTIILNGTFTNWVFFNYGKLISADVVVDGTNATLINSAFYVSRGNNMNLTNINMIYNPDTFKLSSVSSAISYINTGEVSLADNIGSANNTFLNNITINGTLSYINNPEFTLIQVDDGNFTIANSNINITVETITELSTPKKLFNLTSENNKIINSTINMNIPSYPVNWENSPAAPSFIGIALGSNGVLDYNNITNNVTESFDASGSSAAFATSEIFLTGSNHNITNNNFNFSSDTYQYGLWLSAGSSSNNISNNNFTVYGLQYANAVYLNHHHLNNIIENNYMNITCGMNPMGVSPNGAENVAYPIAIENIYYQGGTYSPGTGTVNNTSIVNNTIISTGYNVYGIEVYGADNTTIENNTIILNAHTPMGIGITGADTIINGNTITIVGETNETESSADYFKPTTVGISTQKGQNTTIYNNTITATNGPGITVMDSDNNVTYNTIITNNEWTVTLDGTAGYDYNTASNTNVTNNSLRAQTLTGDASVSNLGTDNIVLDNGNVIFDTVISIDSIEDTIALTNTTVSGILSTVNGEAISGVTVNIIVLNGTTVIAEYSNITDTDGNYYYTISNNLSIDNKVINVSFEGNEDYTASENNTSYTVSSLETSIIIDSIETTKIGETITITGTLTANNEALTNTDVTVTINDEEKTVQTDDNGIFTINYTTSVLGTNNIIASYDGVNPYLSSDTTSTFTVEKIATSITVDPVTGVLKEKVIFTANILDENGEKVTGGTVTFKVNGETLTTTATVKDGVAKFTYTAQKSWIQEDSIIIAEYSGTDVYIESEATNTIVIEARTATLTIITPNIITKGGETIKITVQVTDNGNIIASGKVAFKINSKTIGYATVENGIATIEYTIPTGWGARDYNITAVFSNSNYKRAEANTTLTIQRTNTHIDLNPIYTTKNNTKTVITATILDENNNLVTANTQVSIKLNGKTVATTTAVNGVINTTIDTSKYTQLAYDLTLTAGTNNRYNNCTTTNALIIKEQ